VQQGAVAITSAKWPSILAVFKLIASSSLVGNSTQAGLEAITADFLISSRNPLR